MRLAGRRAAASALEPQHKADSGDGYGKAGGRWTVVRARADRICDFLSSLSGPGHCFRRELHAPAPPSVTPFMENDLRYGASIPATMKGCLGELKKIEGREMHDADSD